MKRGKEINLFFTSAKASVSADGEENIVLFALKV